MSQSHWISPGLAVCIAYGLVSMSISLAYKALLSSYAYNGKYIMLAAQMALSLMFSLAAKVSMHFAGPRAHARQWFAPECAATAHL